MISHSWSKHFLMFEFKHWHRNLQSGSHGGIKYRPLFKRWLSRLLICEMQMSSYIHKLKSNTTTYLDHEYVSLTTSFSSKSSTCSKSLIHIPLEPSDVRRKAHIPQQVKFLNQLLCQNHKLYPCKPTLE